MSTPAHANTLQSNILEFATAAEWFAVTVAGVDLRAPVPTCPGWTVFHLVAHLGNVHSWAATIVETGQAAAELTDEPPRKAKPAAEWYAGKAEDLFEVLRAADPDAPCWNFAFGLGTKAFWPRRQLHETTVHSIDLALAAGRIPDLRPEVSADGIDEALRVFLHRMHSRGFPADLQAPLSVVATDVERSWTVRPSDGPPEVLEGATAPDRISGPAAAVYALLWKRLPATDAALHFTGDTARIGAFLGSRLTA